MRERFLVRALDKVSPAVGLACLLAAACVNAAPQGETKPPNWRADGKQVDIDLDLSKEHVSVALPPLPGDVDWPYYNNHIDGQRFSALDEINVGNVDRLQELCRVRISGAGPNSAGTIVVGGLLYTTAWRTTIAIQPTDCDVVWKSIYTPEQSETYNANRGVAYADGKVFRGTGDGRLLAYDAASGRELWRTKVGDPAIAEYTDSAPVAWGGKVFIGLAGGDFGIVGRVMAFDQGTGAPAWSFNTIPQPGEYGNDTWPNDTWKSGGGGTWSSYTLDPGSAELFVPVANPAPDFNAEIRKGDNLYTNSVLVLDARTGKRHWHFQTRKNDNHDYGLGSPAVLFELDHQPMVAQGSKDGFLYLIDRTKHSLVWKTAVSSILNHTADATAEGVKVCPGAKGGIAYNSPAYDPKHGLLVVGSVEWCYSLRKEALTPHVPGSPYMAGRMEHADDGTGWVTAVEAKSGRIVWRYRTPAPVIAGVTTTAGDITFAGDAAGTLYVFKTSDGTLLQKLDTGGALAGGIITYRSQGHQYLAVNSGNLSRSSWSAAAGAPSLIIYRLPGADEAQAADARANPPDAGAGKGVYQSNCSVCHGPQGRGGEAPKLTGLSGKFDQQQTVDFIKAPSPNMPKLYPSVLSAQDVADVAAYVRSLGP